MRAGRKYHAKANLKLRVVLTVAFALMLMPRLAHGQTGAPRVQDIPGPNRLWFLEPLTPRTSTPSTDMNHVAIELTNRAGKAIVLRIPRAYIAQISDPRETAQTYVTLAVYFPDYLPRFLADRAGHKTRGEIINSIELRSKEEVAIELRVTTPGTLRKSIEWMRGNRIDGGTFRGEFDLYYDVFRPTPHEPPQPRKEIEYLVPHGSDDLMIRCVTNLGTSEMLGCRMKFEREDLEVQVAFSSNYLDEYTQVKNRVAEIVESFIN